MLYNILAVIIGALALINAIILAITKKDKMYVTIINLVFSLLFLVIGIVGFIMPSDFEYITILLMLLVAIGYLVFFYTIGKNSINKPRNYRKQHNPKNK